MKDPARRLFLDKLIARSREYLQKQFNPIFMLEFLETMVGESEIELN